MLYGDGYQTVTLDNGWVVTFEAIVVDPLQAEPIMWDAYLHGMAPEGGMLLGTVARIDKSRFKNDGMSDYWLHTPAGVIHPHVDPLLGNVADSYDRLLQGPVSRTAFESVIKEWAAIVFG